MYVKKTLAVFKGYYQYEVIQGADEKRWKYHSSFQRSSCDAFNS